MNKVFLQITGKSVRSFIVCSTTFEQLSLRLHTLLVTEHCIYRACKILTQNRMDFKSFIWSIVLFPFDKVRILYVSEGETINQRRILEKDNILARTRQPIVDWCPTLYLTNLKTVAHSLFCASIQISAYSELFFEFFPQRSVNILGKKISFR